MHEADLLGKGALSGLDHLPRFIVVETLVGKMTVFQNQVSCTLAFVHDDDDGETQFVLSRAEGTDTVRQFFGQHGDGAVDQVNRGGPFVGFFIEPGMFADVMGDIGDVDLISQRPSGRPDRKGVVEILRVDRIDGKVGTERKSPFADLWGVISWKSPVPFHVRGKLQWESVLGQDGMHLGVVLTRPAQDAGDAAHRVLAFLGQSTISAITFCPCSAFDSRCPGMKISISILGLSGTTNAYFADELYGSDEFGARTFEHLYHFSLDALVAVFRIEEHLHLVAVQRLPDVPWGDETSSSSFRSAGMPRRRR